MQRYTHFTQLESFYMFLFSRFKQSFGKNVWDVSEFLYVNRLTLLHGCFLLHFGYNVNTSASVLLLLSGNNC